jgi:hypothetical protein
MPFSLLNKRKAANSLMMTIADFSRYLFYGVGGQSLQCWAKYLIFPKEGEISTIYPDKAPPFPSPSYPIPNSRIAIQIFGYIIEKESKAFSKSEKNVNIIL